MDIARVEVVLAGFAGIFRESALEVHGPGVFHDLLDGPVVKVGGGPDATLAECFAPTSKTRSLAAACEVHSIFDGIKHSLDDSRLKNVAGIIQAFLLLVSFRVVKG